MKNVPDAPRADIASQVMEQGGDLVRRKLRGRALDQRRRGGEWGGQEL